MDDTGHTPGTGGESFPKGPVRINKYLARSGYCSRRQADTLVREERVTIDGRVALLGATVPPGARVRVDGEPVTPHPDTIVLAFNKPRGVVTTTDEREPDNIMSILNFPERVFPVGRLDRNSSGLILFTNDGDISRRILHPAYRHEKEYVVRLDRPFGDDLLACLRKGIVLDGRPTRPCSVERLGARAFRIVLTEGRNRQIRRMCEACGHRVLNLRRTRIMHIELGDLPPGKWRRLNPARLFPPDAGRREDS